MPVQTGLQAQAVKEAIPTVLHRLSRRGLFVGVFAAASGVVLKTFGVRLRAQATDEVTDADLERSSIGRTIRVGSVASGAITVLPLEVYVSRVLAAENDPRAMDAAKEALAIAIRTYALVERRHARDGFDVCDTTHCQVIRGSSATTRRLTLNTALQILTYDRQPAVLYYSASCGGYSERASDVWPNVNLPYLQARLDPVHEDDQPWTLDLPMSEAESVLTKMGFTGQLAGMEVDARTGSGRAGSLRVFGMEPPTVGGDAFRLAYSATRMRSTAYTLATVNQTLRFTGTGYGHGVGMCVIGAGKRAQRGESARQILEHYYPGLQLVRLDPVDSTPSAAAPRTVPRPQPFPRPR